MQPTAIKAGAPPNTGVNTAITAERPKTHTREKPLLLQGLEVAASLRITVILFTLAIFLVFFGTWAQRDASIWTVVKDYFRSMYVFIPLKVLLMYSVDDWAWNWAIPYPGGWLLGGLLLANLLAAHIVRFKLSWKRSGILLIHGGLIVMMLGELITGLFQIESRMFIMEGNSANFVERDRAVELAIVDRSDPKVDREVIVSDHALARGGVIQGEPLPFDVEVIKYMPNADTPWREDDDGNPANRGIGRRKTAVPRKQSSGADTDARPDTPAAYVAIKEKETGKPLGIYLVSTWFTYLQKPPDEVVMADGKRYAISLRHERDYRNYVIQLVHFSHDKYVGTEIAKNFSSLVRIKEAENVDKEGRQVLIYMNHPLFYQGETFYQASLHPLTTGTVLQVVSNPGWWMPYISCLLVSGGMLVHFGLHLFSFLQKRAVA